MAKPRIFVSSTYFDLRVVRADLERFMNEIGYEAVLFERGHISYGSDAPLEDYCYREIQSCDILVAIIGGKYGTESQDKKNSITQKELKTAVDLGKQIYVFVENQVHNEYKTYQANKDLKGFKPVSVNNVKVFDILQEIYALPSGNPIEPFEISEDIIHYLKEQWAGLFQRFLQEATKQREIITLQNIQETAATLNQLVTYLTDQQSKEDETIKRILIINHPAFSAIKKVVGISHRVIFSTLNELDQLLSSRGFHIDKNNMNGDKIDWDNFNAKKGIRVKKEIFDDKNNLKIIEPKDWKDEYITTYRINPIDEMEDEIPF